ncbi:MAG: hypothetical protein GQ582_13470 [Methyloprofundus sp.]|nr:hypothetical protein [Methyloprofundus sp.]
MNTQQDTKVNESFIHHPGWFKLRGQIMLVLGVLLTLFSMLAPNVSMLGVVSSWLPFSSVLIMAYGLLRCIDAFAAEHTSHAIMNAQNGIIDMVCGFMIFSNVGEPAEMLGIIVAAYLLMQGLNRMVMVVALELVNPNSVRIGGVVSILFGLMVWLSWPFSGLWFLSFAMGAEIANRGWALVFYAKAVAGQQAESLANSDR